MTYEIEITINNDTLIGLIEFSTFRDMIHFYNETERDKTYCVKYRGCMLRSYEVFPDYNGTKNELRKYCRYFPEDPSDYIQTLPNIDNTISQTPTTNKKDNGWLCGSIILSILLFPLFLILGAINNK